MMTHFTNVVTNNRRVVQFLHSKNNAPAFKVRITYAENVPESVTIIGNSGQGVGIPVLMLADVADLLNELAIPGSGQ